MPPFHWVQMDVCCSHVAPGRRAHMLIYQGGNGIVIGGGVIVQSVRGVCVCVLTWAPAGVVVCHHGTIEILTRTTPA